MSGSPSSTSPPPPHPGGIPSIVCDSGSSPAWLASEGKEGLERRSVHLLID